MRTHLDTSARRVTSSPTESNRHPMTCGLIRLLLLTSVLLLVATSGVGCSTFHRQWSQARKLPSNGLEGAWDGRWISDLNGHNGRLRCVIEPISNTQCRAKFKAHYWGILRFRYSVVLDLTTKDGTTTFKGDANLGYLAGGNYSYEGSSTSTEFQSTYKSRYDHGRFELKRP